MMMTRQGFTLVEVLVTALIMTLIGGALLVVAIAGRRVSDLTNARLTAMTNAQQAVNRLTPELRGTTTPADVRCDMVRDGAARRLKIPDSAGYLISYTFRNGQLKRTHPDAGDPELVFAGVSNFQVVCSAANGDPQEWVKIQVTARANAWRPMTQTLESQVRIRHPSS